MNMNNQYHFDNIYTLIKKTIKNHSFVNENNTYIMQSLIKCGSKKNQYVKVAKIFEDFYDNEYFQQYFLKFLNKEISKNTQLNDLLLKFADNILIDENVNSDVKSFILYCCLLSKQDISNWIRNIDSKKLFIQFDVEIYNDKNTSYLLFILSNMKNNLPVGVRALYKNIKDIDENLLSNEYVDQGLKIEQKKLKTNINALIKTMDNCPLNDKSKNVFYDFLVFIQNDIDFDILDKIKLNVTSRVLDIKYLKRKTKGFNLIQDNYKNENNINFIQRINGISSSVKNDDVTNKSKKFNRKIENNIIDNSIFRGSYGCESIFLIDELCSSKVVAYASKQNQFNILNNLNHFECALVGLSVDKLKQYQDCLFKDNSFYCVSFQYFKTLRENLKLSLDFYDEVSNVFLNKSLFLKEIKLSEYIEITKNTYNNIEYDFVNKNKKFHFLKELFLCNSKEDILNKKKWLDNLNLKLKHDNVLGKDNSKKSKKRMLL